MTHTTNLSLPYILPAQAQKHVTHNEALLAIDALVHLCVQDNGLSAPPQTPNNGDRYIVAASATGEWVGKENQIAAWQDQAWAFFNPQTGWVSWVENQDALYAYDGNDWVVASSGGGSGVSLADLEDGTVTTLGVNADADTTNRLSVNSAAILFNKEVDDVQIKLNKQASSDNASFLFQTNFSGRAEIGTAGDDDFHFKVSSDGVSWKEGILINKSTGEVSFPNTTLNGITSADPLDNLVTRIFNRVSPTQWGFCHVASDGFTDLAKTTQADAVNDVVAVIADKSPNNIDLVAGGTDAANKIKLRLDPLTVGVDAAHLTTHYLKVAVPTGGFQGKLIIAYRGGCLVHDMDVPAGDWKIWSGDSMQVNSGFIGAFAAENMSNADIDKILEAFYNLGADSKPLSTAFSWCLNASNFSKTIDLSNFDFSICTNMYQLMRGAEAKKIILPGNDLSSVTSMVSAFRGCSSLTSLDTSNWDLSSVTSMHYTFYGCSSLTSLDTSNWDLSSVTSMYSAFYGCSSLTSLDTSNWDLSAVTSMYYTFRGCSSLTSLDTSNWDLSSVISMVSAFYGCSSLTSLDTSNWDLSDVTNMAYAFYGCSNLTSLIIGSVFDSTACTNFISTFTNCALNQQTVDDILVSIEKAGTSNGTLNINGGTSSAPSSVGATAKTALQGRGWTVTTN